MRRGDTLLGMVTIVASEAGIEQLLWMMNPDKIAAMADVTERSASASAYFSSVAWSSRASRPG
jgi:hypothetical protein